MRITVPVNAANEVTLEVSEGLAGYRIRQAFLNYTQAAIGTELLTMVITNKSGQVVAQFIGLGTTLLATWKATFAESGEAITSAGGGAADIQVVIPIDSVLLEEGDTVTIRAGALGGTTLFAALMTLE